MSDGSRSLENTEASLCAEVRQLSLQSDRVEDTSAVLPTGLANGAQGVGMHRLSWYEQLLPFVARYESCALDWKAWANSAVCLYQMGEKKASWDSYKQAALASRNFQIDLSDEEASADPHVGKYLCALAREFCLDGWSSDGNSDLELFVVLSQQQRASEVAMQRWHIILPNHYFAVTQALCAKLSSSSQIIQSVCIDDSRMEMQHGNCLALLGSPEGLYVQTSDAKRAKLQDCVKDICIEVRATCEGSASDFDVVEVAPFEES